jgi:hypothetical protein
MEPERQEYKGPRIELRQREGREERAVAAELIALSVGVTPPIR